MTEVVATGLYPFGQYVIGVGGDHDLSDRQAETMGIVSAERITKIAAGYVQHDTFTQLDRLLSHQRQVAMKLVQHLEYDAPEVNRVGG